MTQLDTMTEIAADDFAYGAAEDDAGLPTRVAIFADRDGVRAEFAEDLEGAGFRTIDGGPIGNLLDGPITLLGDVVMVDCPILSADTMAALVRLDMRVAQAGAKLIVTTSIDALDAVFAALDQSDPQILVQPSRADRILAVGRVLADLGSARVREMSDVTGSICCICRDRSKRLRINSKVLRGVATGMLRFERMPILPVTLARLHWSRPHLISQVGKGSTPTHHRCPIRSWFGVSSQPGRRAPSSLKANCSPIPPGTCCSILRQRRQRKTRCRSLRSASRLRFLRRRRCAGSSNWWKPACSCGSLIRLTAAGPLLP